MQSSVELSIETPVNTDGIAKSNNEVQSLDSELDDKSPKTFKSVDADELKIDDGPGAIPDTRLVHIVDNTTKMEYGPIDSKWCEISEFFKAMLDADKNTTKLPIYYDYDGNKPKANHLENVVQYFKECAGTEPKLAIEKPLTIKDPNIMYPVKFTRDWLMNIKESSKLCELIKLINFLHIPNLLDNVCARLSMELQGETQETVKDIMTGKTNFKY